MNPNIEYVINNEIIEYDLQDAGINIIKAYRLLDQETISSLEILEKKARHIAVGKLQGKDKEFSKAFLEKFSDLRKLFIDSNKLTSNRIISVKKDAIYTIGPCPNLSFGRILFVPKNYYSSYIRLPVTNIEIYYSDTNLDFKGMGENATNVHRLYLSEFIKEYINKLEKKDISIKRYLRKIIDDYKSSKLDESYYIEFNNKSKEFNALYNLQTLITPLVMIALRELS